MIDVNVFFIRYALFQELKEDVAKFRNEWEASGPMVQGISPLEAVERLRRFKEEMQLRERKVRDGLSSSIFIFPHVRWRGLWRSMNAMSRACFHDDASRFTSVSVRCATRTGRSFFISRILSRNHRRRNLNASNCETPLGD